MYTSRICGFRRCPIDGLYQALVSIGPEALAAIGSGSVDMALLSRRRMKKKKNVWDTCQMDRHYVGGNDCAYRSQLPISSHKERVQFLAWGTWSGGMS